MKKIHPVSVILIIIAIAGIAFSGFCVYNKQIPIAIAIFGCSIVLLSIPSMLNSKDDDVSDNSAVAKKKDVFLGSFKGRCRVLDDSSIDCVMYVSTTRIDFKTPDGQNIIAILRSSIQRVDKPNQHTLLFVVNGGDYRFISGDSHLVQDAYGLLC